MGSGWLNGRASEGCLEGGWLNGRASEGCLGGGWLNGRASEGCLGVAGSTVEPVKVA